MATVEIWIQLEPHAWDAAPSLPVDRATAAGVQSTGQVRQAQLHSPGTGVRRVQRMNLPAPGEALILRRYTRDWAGPDDRKVNPWDLNEPDPSDAGTMGTIPGATIECEVGDTLRVHFRNRDFRTEPRPPWEPAGPVLHHTRRTHSLHGHGVSFGAAHDGAYPLSPPDPEQPVGDESAEWRLIGVTGRYKQGDRVPPGATFTYRWEAKGPASAGIWHYHDHSICDHDNVARGAIGCLVVRNPADALGEVEITPAHLPDGSWTGSPVDRNELLPGLVRLRVGPSITELLEDRSELNIVRWGDVRLELDAALTGVTRVGLDRYRMPPDQARYLLLFHELAGVGMCINGRKYLGNAPTLVAGPATRMRFGVIGMGETFHTFHIHGHRWVVRGPSGVDAATIEQSVQAEPVSQFEDTKVFGPGSSFAFTLEEGNGLFRADPPVGEWHLHCHVGHHMMEGMVGSLLVVNGGELALPLPIGRACPPEWEPPARREPRTFDVRITEYMFTPARLAIQSGDTVRWINDGRFTHACTALDKSWDERIGARGSWSRVFANIGVWEYNCFVDHSEDRHNKDDRFHPRISVFDADPGTPGGFPGIAPPVAGGGGAAAPAPGGGSSIRDVTIGPGGFAPGSVTIKAGDSVRWTNTDSSPHSATADDHSWASPTLTSGKSFARVFPAAGSYPMHCHLHHEMTATVVVT